MKLDTQERRVLLEAVRAGIDRNTVNAQLQTSLTAIQKAFRLRVLESVEAALEVGEAIE